MSGRNVLQETLGATLIAMEGGGSLSREAGEGRGGGGSAGKEPPPLPSPALTRGRGSLRATSHVRRARRFTPRLLLVLALASVLSIGCRQQSVEPAPAQAPAAANPQEASTDWVALYDPERAWNGFTLTLHQGRIPVLLDMNGRTIHQWPEARVKSRVRLLPDGSILAIGLGRQVVEYDWDGQKTWEFPTPDAIPHHDVIRLANGNTLVLILREGETADTLVEVDRAGKVVWTWRAIDHLGELIPAKPSHPNDITHINSMQELPENPWHAAGDQRFRPGNLLLSARNLNTIFVIDRRSGAVVWSYQHGLDMQHEALMNGPDLPAPGMIQVFNNRFRSFPTDRQSELIEIDPRDNSVVWSYRSPGFFSPTAGVQQALPNGNLLVTSTRGGRVFEITRKGETVWEWIPPYQPGRSSRVPFGACPQLTMLDPQPPKAISRPPGDRHVDVDAYRFARQGSRKKAVLNGEKRTVLKQEDDCRDLLLPADPQVQVGYGVDRERLRAAGGKGSEFRLVLRPKGTDREVEILRDTVGLEGEPWRRRTIPLAPYSLQAVQMCMEIDGAAAAPTPSPQRFAFWEQPLITSGRSVAPTGEGDNGDDDMTPGDLTEEELEVRRKHLKSLGYVG